MGQVPWKRSVRYDDPSGAWAAAGSRGVRVSRKVRVSGVRHVCPATSPSVRLARSRVFGPRESSCVRAKLVCPCVRADVCPARFVCPESGTSVRGQVQVRLSDSSVSQVVVCPGRRKGSVCPGADSGASSCVRVSGPTQELVCPGGKSVCPTLGLDSGADSGARFVRVSEPGSSVCPGRRKGGKSVCPTLGLTQGPGSFVRFVRLSGLARARVSGPVRPTLGARLWG